MAERPVLDLRRQTSGGSVLSGALWTLLVNATAPGLLLIQSLVAARFLGPTRMGQQSYIAWVELSVSFALSAGASGTLARYLGLTIASGRGGSMRSVLRNVVRIELAVAPLPVALFAGVIGPRTHLGAAWTLAGVCAGLLIAQSVASATLVALQQWRVAALIAMVTGAVATVATIVVLAAGGGITGMFAVETGTLVLSGLWSAVRARSTVRTAMPPPAADDGLRREVLSYAGIATVQVGLAYLVWQRSEFFFLDRYSPARQIALYSIAFALVGGLQRLPEALTQPLVPSLAVLVGSGEAARIRRAASRAVHLAWVVATPFAAGIAALGPLALRLLYGLPYRSAGGVAVLLVLVLPVVVLARIGASVLHANGRIRTVLGCLAVGFAVDVAVCIALIPRHGAIGAAWANVCGQGVAAVLEVGCARMVLGPVRLSGARLARTLLSALVAGFAGYAVTRAVPNAGGLIAGATVIAVAAALGVRLLRPLNEADLAWLHATVQERMGHRWALRLRWLTGDGPA